MQVFAFGKWMEISELEEILHANERDYDAGQPTTLSDTEYDEAAQCVPDDYEIMKSVCKMSSKADVLAWKYPDRGQL